MSDALPLAAALRADGSLDVDQLLDEQVHALRAQGLRLHGLLMTYPEGRADCHCAMVLQDLRTGETYPVSQALGAESQACRADPQGFARASQVLRDALAPGTERPDLVVVNRFGKLEVAGGGFRDEFLALMAEGVPVLTAVASALEPAWRDFTGGAPVLPADPQAVQDWVRQAVPSTGA